MTVNTDEILMNTVNTDEYTDEILMKYILTIGATAGGRCLMRSKGGGCVLWLKKEKSFLSGPHIKSFFFIWTS